MCYCPTPTLHLNLALTGDGAFQISPQKTYSVWFISVLNYGDTENVLINHLLLVIPMSYPCHYTNLCPHKPHKHAHTHTHTHTRWFLWFTGTFHMRNGFYTVQAVCAIALHLHLNLALTGDGAFLLPPQQTYSAWFISILNYGDTENVFINHFLLVIPMSYPCHYTNLCPHKPHKHAHTHTNPNTQILSSTTASNTDNKSAY